MTFTSDQARELAIVRVPCPWCGLRLRPCNLTRHVERTHHRQMTIWDVFDSVEAERRSGGP